MYRCSSHPLTFHVVAREVAGVVLGGDDVQAGVRLSVGLREGNPARDILWRSVVVEGILDVLRLPVTVRGEASAAGARVDVEQQEVEGGNEAQEDLGKWVVPPQLPSLVEEQRERGREVELNEFVDEVYEAAKQATSERGDE